jgi:hypothetical protein
MIKTDYSLRAILLIETDFIRRKTYSLFPALQNELRK